MKDLVSLYSWTSKVLDPSLYDKLALSVYAQYAQAGRYYHTIDHVQSCLDELDMWRNSSEYPYTSKDAYVYESFKYAIWYHDIVMFTKMDKSSEELSANRMFLDGKLLELPDELIFQTIKLILITKHDSEPLTSVERYMVDIDLSILGKVPDVYQRYASVISVEYADIEYLVFCRERLKVLNKFMERPSIYSTRFFKNLYEVQARKNLSNEIKLLEETLRNNT